MEDRIRDIQEMNARMQSEFRSVIDYNYKEYSDKCNKWHKNNRIQARECIKNYEKTEKGKIAVKRRQATRQKRVRDQSDGLSFIELENIKKFYVNCPLGMVVDHIVPIKLGGRHHISNLQYLPRSINAKKSSKHPDELKDLDWYQPYVKGKNELS